MQTDAAAAAAVLSYPIAYQVFAGTACNSELRGQGMLIIRPAAPSYAFTGRKRRPFFPGPPVTREFGTDDIWNVAVSGRMVQFTTGPGKPGQQNRPFLFFCHNAAEAAAVAALLPDRKDADLVAAEDFKSRLDSLPGAGRPWSSVTNLVIATNVLTFVAMAGLLGAGWFEVTDLMPYIRCGANNGAATTDGEWWRLVTSLFLHFGLLHLLFNLWALFQVGHLVEKLLGRAAYVLVYLGSGVIGSLASIVWHGDRLWSAGASGAIFGVYGALLGYLWREKRGMPRTLFSPMLKSTVVFAGYNLAYGATHPGIDNVAHLGGLLGGIAIGWLVAIPIDPQARARLRGPRLVQGAVACGMIVACGIVVAPRFDYRPAEELAWSGAMRGLDGRETDVVGHYQTLAQQYDPGAPASRARLAASVEQEFIPFYEGMARQLGALHYSAGHRTEHRRAGLLQFAQTRAAAGRQLLVDLQAARPAALRDFEAVNQKAVDALKDAVAK